LATGWGGWGREIPKSFSFFSALIRASFILDEFFQNELAED
jgi:hypothetical protein